MYYAVEISYVTYSIPGKKLKTHWENLRVYIYRGKERVSPREIKFSYDYNVHKAKKKRERERKTQQRVRAKKRKSKKDALVCRHLRKSEKVHIALESAVDLWNLPQYSPSRPTKVAARGVKSGIAFAMRAT